MKAIYSLVSILLFNTFVGVAVCNLVGVDPLYGAVASNALSLIPRENVVLMAGLNKEIWISELMERFYPDWSFLRESRDLSEFVEYNKINLAEAGVDPNVLINNTTWPIPYAQRADVPLELPLDTYDTENTLVRNIEEMETAYNKMASVVMGHRNALINKLSQKAAHAWAPGATGQFTPVKPTTGAGANGFKKITLDDIDKLSTDLDLIDAPDAGRILVLHPTHLSQLRAEDRQLFKGYVEHKPGFELMGFKVYKYRKTATFNKNTGEKKAFGAAAAPTTDTISSLAYVNTEVMRCEGTVEMFSKIKDPGERGDILGFQMRALALPMRNKYSAAIYSDAV